MQYIESLLKSNIINESDMHYSDFNMCEGCFKILGAKTPKHL